MNTKWYKYIILFVLAFMALPMMAQDYLTITFKDGKEERHLMSLINEIYTSKYDKAGVLQSDYITQVISMKDTVYYYAIEDIDSISFKSVSEEQMYQNFVSALSKIDEVLDMCESVKDLYSFSNEIAKAPGVEKVDVYDDAIVVRVKDCRDIVFFDIPMEDGMMPFANTRRWNQLMQMKNSERHKINQTIRVAIADQNAKTEGQGYVNSTICLREIEGEFSKMGYDVDYIAQPGLDFFRKNIFDYDIIMLTTHGGYIDGKHWFATGLEIEEYNPSIGWSKDKMQDYYNTHDDFEDIKYLYLNEVRNGKNTWVLYNVCSEDYISKSPYRFKNDNAILFTNVCHSLDKRNTVADMFFEKGASTYLGYTGSTGDGEYAGKQFFVDFMLNGASTEYAYEHLLDKYIKEPNGAELCFVQKESERNKAHFITKTQTVEKTQKQIDDDLQIKGELLLEGITSLDELENNPIGLKYGFRIATKPNVDTATSFTSLYSKDIHYSSEVGGDIFTASFNPEADVTYYYRAFTYDDIHYNWGEERSFTIYPDLQVAAQKLELEKGEKVSFTITAGSGEYSVESSDKSVAKANVVGNEVYIEAVSEGKEATITVTDTKSGQKATVTVITISYGPPLSIGDAFIADGVTYMVTSIKPLEVQIGNCEKGSGVESAIEWYMRGETGDFTIPSKVKGTDGNIYSVTRLGKYSFGNCSFTSVSIPNSITSIGEMAFLGCSGLTSIKIPESVASIEDYAFYECSGLTSIKIPESVISIGSFAFSKCSSLYSIIIPKNVNSFGYFVFYDCSYLHTVIVLCSPTNIDMGSKQLFKDCNNITEAVFDCSTVTPILCDQTSLKRVTLKESVTTIEDHAFYGCSNLNTITISNSVTSIGDVAFFKCTGLKSITIPNSVITIGKEAFRACESLSTVKIGNNVTSIGEGAFLECIGLITVTIGNNVTSIGDFAFFQCGSLKSVNIPGSVRSIGCFAFKDCSSLNSITIPKGVSFIDSGAFRNCSALAAIYAEATEPIKVEYWLFEGVDTDNCVLYVPKGCVDKYRGATAWGNFKKIVEH